MSTQLKRQALDFVKRISHLQAEINILQHRILFCCQPHPDLMRIQDQIVALDANIKDTQAAGREVLFTLMNSGISHRQYLKFIQEHS